MLISNSSRPTWLICAMAAMRVLVGTMLTMVQSSSGMRSNDNSTLVLPQRLNERAAFFRKQLGKVGRNLFTDVRFVGVVNEPFLVVQNKQLRTCTQIGLTQVCVQHIGGVTDQQHAHWFGHQPR
jgi:hypothetical protein